jgi:diacylglycerol kinase family enzyme
LKVSLLYNCNAGDSVPLHLIHDTIERHGHQLVQVIERDEEIERMLDGAPELVVAAGGDGTISAAARRLSGRKIPLAILPLGTANNIAKAVGSQAPIEQLIAGWEIARRRALDLGVARADSGSSRYFVEGVGAGLIPGGILEMRMRSTTEAAPTRSRLAEAGWTYSSVLERMKPAVWTVVVDGVRTTGEFLLVEVLNIGSIGPNLKLSNDADPFDGLFSIVLAGEEHRTELARYLGDRLEARESSPALPVQQGRRIRLEGTTEVHVDDQILCPRGTVAIELEAGAVDVLV